MCARRRRPGTEWLARINPGLAYPLDKAEFVLRAGAVADALAELPAAVFSVATAREVIRRQEYFPGGARLTALLTPYANEVRRLLRGLKTVTSLGAVAPESPRPRWQGEVDAIVARFRPQFAQVIGRPRRAEAGPGDPRTIAAVDRNRPIGRPSHGGQAAGPSR